jgi:hypothetical protein
MKVPGEWEGIPGFWLDDPASPDGKRWIATHYGWEKVCQRVKALCQGRCELNLSDNCSIRSHWLDTHHRRGRGGGKRDDRIWILGVRALKAACRPCHAIAKIETLEEVFGDESMRMRLRSGGSNQDVHESV